MKMRIIQKNQFFITFAIGWLAYASSYLLRKPLGIAKADMETELGYTMTDLGWLDFALWLPYAAFGLFFGSLGDQWGERRTFAACLFLAGCSMLTFGWWSSLPAFAALLFFNGGAQSLCWPCSVKAVTSWVPNSQLHVAVGLFDTGAFTGGVFATWVAVRLQESYGWRALFLGPSLAVMIVSTVVYAGFRSAREEGYLVPGKAAGVRQKVAAASSEHAANLSLSELVAMPCLWQVAMAAFCLKLVRYTVYMWLPIYLYESLDYGKSDAGMMSSLFELGGILGTATIGLVIARLFAGDALWGCTVALLLSAVALVAFTWTTEWGTWANVTCLLVAGCLNCGAGCVLGGSVPAQIGGSGSGARVISFVSGVSSVGTFLEGPIVGRVADHYGWRGMLYLMVVTSLLGTWATYSACRARGRSTGPLAAAESAASKKLTVV